MRTRIIANLGPMSETSDVLAAMLRAGMSFARLNFSHGQPDEHHRRAELVRQASATVESRDLCPGTIAQIPRDLGIDRGTFERA